MIYKMQGCNGYIEINGIVAGKILRAKGYYVSRYGKRDYRVCLIDGYAPQSGYDSKFDAITAALSCIAAGRLVEDLAAEYLI